jgi:hypothetical protein
MLAGMFGKRKIMQDCIDNTIGGAKDAPGNDCDTRGGGRASAGGGSNSHSGRDKSSDTAVETSLVGAVYHVEGVSQNLPATATQSPTPSPSPIEGSALDDAVPVRSKRRRLRIQVSGTPTPGGIGEQPAQPATSSYHDLSIAWNTDSYKRTDSDWAMDPEYPRRFRVQSLVGEGSFGTVYKGFDTRFEEQVAIKIMKPQRLSLVKREVYILSVLAGKPNIVHLRNVVIDWLTHVPCLVFEYLEHTDYGKVFPTLSADCVISYMYQLLTALHHCRCHGFLHRDVKPANIVFHPEHRRLTLIDWGTAEIYLPDKDLTYRVGTRSFRAPELLAGCARYDFSIDIWSAGCVLWQLAWGSKDPAFGYGNDELDQLNKITQRLGTVAFVRWHRFLGLKRLGSPQMNTIMKDASDERKEFGPDANDCKEERLRVCKEKGAFDLLDHMLCFDPSTRLDPASAMAHSFFKS